MAMTVPSAGKVRSSTFGDANYTPLLNYLSESQTVTEENSSSCFGEIEARV